MRIGIDAKRIVNNTAGLGSYGRTLTNILAADSRLDLHLYAPNKGRDALRGQIAERENVKFHYWKKGFLPKALGSGLWRSYGIVSDLKRDGIELYHGIAGELPIGIRKSGIKSVVTVHDVIFLHHPEFYRQHDGWVYRWKFRHTLQEADHFVAISETTKRDLMTYAHVDESKITLIYQTCAPRFSAVRNQALEERVRTLYSLPARFMLSVGTVETRKNILLAVKALHHLPDDLALVVVGSYKQYTKVVNDYIAKHGMENRVILLHNVPDEHLPAFYTMAEVFVYPSWYEGFGIPVVEAIHCGLPVVACTGSSLEEAGGPDCLYVAPDDEQAMAEAIRQSLRGAPGREGRIVNSQDYVRRFEENDIARQMTALYERLL
ncbi:Glycosyltransferase involved in cell wall bisynthesis [Prevotella sp. ne3005]|uniref:glycosyltransferase family 4 protein n=1 Tax=Prevotella sp. ne3005 TaxID=1761887 RepID=UPI0008BDEFF5|nr:glycosyltransferase family 1 protein [Prevotella sp. ne3005]SEM74693.1 Glycosyltransferase involved in cell wall bisynthesis [Prevotella sp. ne3005]